MKARIHSSSCVVKKPLLSIGMPIYNGARFVQEAIDSILEQDCDLELIISDNGSNDGTEKICRQYVSKDGRVSYHRYDENRGAAWNYNNCFKLSHGRFFKWAACDDKLAPDFGVKCLSVLENNEDVVLAYTRATIIDEEGNFVRYDSDRLDLNDERPHDRFRRYFEAYAGHHTCNPVFGIFKSDVLARTRLIGNFLGSDRILLGEIALRGKIREVQEELFYYRSHPHNSMCGFSDAERILWFDPLNKGKLLLLNWVYFQNWSDSIAKAPLSSSERTMCKGWLYCWALQNIKYLSKELLKSILWPILKKTPRYIGRDSGY